MSIGKIIKIKNLVSIGYFKELLASVKSAMSAKAFLAAEQRIPGLGNGCLQDILFQAGIHPQRKVLTLSDCEQNVLWKQVRLSLIHI